tara:strand:- start:77885 stop:78955 length:1071 start_codon:yes stop_codon:yes gene_type:complete
MQIISDFKKDTQTEKLNPGSYEWWYFDVMSKEGYSLVIIFYDGNPFSRRYIKKIESNTETNASDFPAISISLYKDGTPIFYSFEEVNPEGAEFSETKPFGQIGDNSFEGFQEFNELSYKVVLNQKLETGDLLHGSLIFKSLNADLSEIVSSNEVPNKSEHSWNLIMANCLVECNLNLEGSVCEKIVFNGRGYHDHNTGSEPMKDSFKEWYWGRYHIENSTLIYYLMMVNGEWKKKAWLINESGSVKKLDQKIDFSNHGFNLFGLVSARTFHFEGDGIDAFIQLDHVVDSGPFYQRFFGKVIINRGEKPELADGISEYIFPSRIYSRMFWPLVNMRIKYPGKSHWVQRNHTLYRLTW